MSYRDFYTVAQVAKMLHVSPVTVRNWINSDKLNAGWYQNQWWISKNEYLYIKRKRDIL